jgi:hypothetical protein
MPRSRLLLSLGAVTLFVGTWAPAASASLGTSNYVVDGGAEADTAAADAAHSYAPNDPPWKRFVFDPFGTHGTALGGGGTGLGFTAVQYGATNAGAGQPTFPSGGSGTNFFAGGPANDNDALPSSHRGSGAYQIVDLSAGAADIDAGRVTATLLDTLGGRDLAEVQVRWCQQSACSDVTLGSIGVLGELDSSQHNGFTDDNAMTTDVPHQGVVPVGTRGASVNLVTAESTLYSSAYIHGYIDDVSLTFATAPAPSGGPTGTPSGNTVGGPAADKTPPSAEISVPKQKLGKVAKSGKLVENVTTSEAGTINGQAVLAAKLAKQLGLPANGNVFTSRVKPAIVAKVSASAPKAGTYKLTLKLTAKAKKKLAKLKRVTLTLRTRVADGSGNRRLVTKKLTLKR